MRILQSNPYFIKGDFDPVFSKRPIKCLINIQTWNLHQKLTQIHVHLPPVYIEEFQKSVRVLNDILVYVHSQRDISKIHDVTRHVFHQINSPVNNAVFKTKAELNFSQLKNERATKPQQPNSSKPIFTIRCLFRNSYGCARRWMPGLFVSWVCLASPCLNLNIKPAYRSLTIV